MVVFMFFALLVLVFSILVVPLSIFFNYVWVDLCTEIFSRKTGVEDKNTLGRVGNHVIFIHVLAIILPVILALLNIVSATSAVVLCGVLLNMPLVTTIILIIIYRNN